MFGIDLDKNIALFLFFSLFLLGLVCMTDYILIPDSSNGEGITCMSAMKGRAGDIATITVGEYEVAL